MNRLLFVVTLGIALVLVGMVVLMPWLPAATEQNALLKLFAHDVVVRRAAIACAFALAVTAVVFFRSGQAGAAKMDRYKSSKRSRSRNTIGA